MLCTIPSQQLCLGRCMHAVSLTVIRASNRQNKLRSDFFWRVRPCHPELALSSGRQIFFHAKNNLRDFFWAHPSLSSRAGFVIGASNFFFIAIFFGASAPVIPSWLCHRGVQFFFQAKQNREAIFFGASVLVISNWLCALSSGRLILFLMRKKIAKRFFLARPSLSSGAGFVIGESKIFLVG